MKLRGDDACDTAMCDDEDRPRQLPDPWREGSYVSKHPEMKALNCIPSTHALPSRTEIGTEMRSCALVLGPRPQCGMSLVVSGNQVLYAMIAEIMPGARTEHAWAAVR
jgi:hypothetical protein